MLVVTDSIQLCVPMSLREPGILFWQRSRCRARQHFECKQGKNTKQKRWSRGAMEH